MPNGDVGRILLGTTPALKTIKNIGTKMPQLVAEIIKNEKYMKRYPAYKDSGIEWLGIIPKDWDVKKMKFNASVRFSSVNKKSEEGEQPVRLCNYTDVYYNNSITQEIDFMEATASADEIRKFLLKAGDVLVTKDSEEWNDIAIPAFVATDFSNVLCGYHLAQIRPKKLNGKYLFWLLSANAINYQYVIEASGVTRYGLSNYALSNSLILLPPEKEQTAIADYLDQESAQIDGLIAKKERMIELLKDERAAVINQAVTKGLNPKAEMKDSGIEWLGKIPKHWEIASLRYLFNIKAGGDIKEAYYSEEKTEKHPYPIYTNSIKSDEAYGFSSKSFFKSNTITVTGRGEIGYAIYRDHKYDAIIRLLVLTPKRNAPCKYYAYFINSTVNFFGGSTAVSQLSAEQISPYKVFSPPLPEQQAIAEFLDHKTTQIDGQITRAQKAIELLKEYRTALISEVVTGKIDVREAGRDRK